MRRWPWTAERALKDFDVLRLIVGAGRQNLGDAKAGNWEVDIHMGALKLGFVTDTKKQQNQF